MNKAIIIFSYYYHNSTRNDHIFVNFADHGAPGLVAFPAGGYVSVVTCHIVQATELYMSV